ncbi:transposase [Kitasatospora sp. NBC_00070]|uniref:transposase n=1 Tax=Kitasatospora sp. NBC_00070 TaxID=2975962 RepID=UPI00386013E9
MTFRARPQLEAQRRIREEQATDAWRDQYATRSGVEGTMAQASRRCDVHHARHRGLAKTQGPPAARAHRDGPQPRPHRRLAHRNTTRRQLDLTTHHPATVAHPRSVNWPAES